MTPQHLQFAFIEDKLYYHDIHKYDNLPIDLLITFRDHTVQTGDPPYKNFTTYNVKINRFSAHRDEVNPETVKLLLRYAFSRKDIDYEKVISNYENNLYLCSGRIAALLK